MKISYKWLQGYFDAELPPPDTIIEKLTEYSFEPEGSVSVGSDIVMEFDVLPNRATDCLCHRGFAREISTIFQIPLRDNQVYQPIDLDIDEQLVFNSEIYDSKKCVRHTGRIMTNVAVGASPDWLISALNSVGQRSINNIVDATNYVMLDIGQPNHVFDWGKFSGDKLFIKDASDAKKISLLGGEEVTLSVEDLVLADQEDFLDVAGIKGGVKAELDQGTKDILLSVASFDAVTIRRTARRINILTDASKRFENAPTPELTLEAVDKLTQLILKVAGTSATKVGPINDENYYLPWNRIISINTQNFNRLLGVNINDEELVSICGRLNLHIKSDGVKGGYTVQVPEYRRDLSIPEDIYEEIGRIYGYNRIESIIPDADFTKGASVPSQFYYRELLRNKLAELGYNEIYTYSFVEAGSIALKNIPAFDKGFLRTNLGGQIFEALEKNAYNAPLFGLNEIKIFEIGTVFPAKGRENLNLLVAIDPLKKKLRKQGMVTEIEGDLSKVLQTLGDIDLENYVIEKSDLYIEIDVSKLINDLPIVNNIAGLGFSLPDTFPTFKPFSQYPFVLRDISFWVSDNDPEKYISIVNSLEIKLLQKISHSDTYIDNGKTSLTFSLVFQAYDRTLNDVEIGEIMQTIENLLVKNGAEIR